MLPEAEPPIKYLISLYVTFTTLTTVGYGDITMQTTPELCFGIFMMALGASTFAVVVGNMAALLGKMDMRATAFKERMEDLDDFMHQENLPLDLRFRTRAFFEYGYNHSRDIPSSINELSKSLQTEVALHLYHDLITSVPFFCDCGKDFLTEIILKLKAQTLSPGDYLYEVREHTCLPASLPACLPASLLASLPASLPPCLPACLSTSHRFRHVDSPF